jgi:hypothetical protein
VGTSSQPAAGPFDTEREAAAAVQHITSNPTEAWRDGMHRHLEQACAAAGVELGAYDHAILLWLAGWEPATVAVIAGLIARARQPEARVDLLGEPGVAQPGGGWVSGPST